MAGMTGTFLPGRSHPMWLFASQIHGMPLPIRIVDLPCGRPSPSPHRTQRWCLIWRWTIPMMLNGTRLERPLRLNLNTPLPRPLSLPSSLMVRRPLSRLNTSPENLNMPGIFLMRLPKVSDRQCGYGSLTPMTAVPRMLPDLSGSCPGLMWVHRMATVNGSLIVNMILTGV